MRTILVSKNDWKPAGKRQHAEDQSDVIDEPCVLRDATTNELLAAQLRLPTDNEGTAKAVEMSIKFETDVPMDSARPARLSGIGSRNRVFGTVEPNKLRRRPACSPSRLDIEQAELVKALGALAAAGCNEWQQTDAATHDKHTDIVRSQIHTDWLIGQTPFTSGVINFTAGLPYHKDSGNLIDSWSLMLSLRSNVEGGNLHLPEYGVTLGIFDRSVTIFNGQAIWHGVTPFHISKRNAHRFTIVYYAKQKVTQCGCRTDELRRVQQAASR